MRTDLISLCILFLTYYLGYSSRICHAGSLLTAQLCIATITIWNDVLLPHTLAVRTIDKIYKNQLDSYDNGIPESYKILHSGGKKWQRYDNEAPEYPAYDSPQVNWMVRRKYRKMRDKPPRHEIPSRTRKLSSPRPNSKQALTTTKQAANQSTDTKTGTKQIIMTTKTIEKQSSVSDVVTPKKMFRTISTTSNPRIKTFTRIQTIHGIVIKRTIYEEIIEEQEQEWIVSYAIMALVTLAIVFILAFLFVGAKNKVRHKICGRKLQNRRHTILEVVTSTKLMGSASSKESTSSSKKARRDGKRSSRKNKLSDAGEEKHLVDAADDSDEEYSVMVPGKNFHHAEA